MAEPETTEKTPAGDVKRWQDRVEIAKKSNEAWEQQSGAKRFEDEYNGEFNLTLQTRRGPVKINPINEVFAFVQTDISSVNSRDPYISVNPKTGTVQSAKMWEVALNQEWRALKVKEELDLEMIDKDLVGFAPHCVGYDVEYTGSEKEGNLQISSEKLYSKRLPWRDLIWNIGAQRIPDDCVWMGHRIVKPLNWVKKKYPTAKDVIGTNSPEADPKTASQMLYKDDIQFVTMWKIWDSETRTTFMLADGMRDTFLENPKPWPDYIKDFGMIYQIYWDYLTANKSRPMSAIAPWEPMLLDSIFLLTSAVNHVKRWNRQLMSKAGTFSEQAMDMFEQGVDGAMIENNGTGDINANARFLDFGQLPTDFYLLLDRLSAIRREIHGQPEFERGGVTKTGSRTEGELQLIGKGAQGRTDRKIDRFETHQENIARAMLACMKANWDGERLVTVTGDTPKEVIEALGDNFDPLTRTVKFTPEEIQNEYEVEIKAGSTLPLDRQTKLAIEKSILQTLGTVSPDGVSPLLNALIQDMLDGYDIKSLKEAYQQEQQVEAQSAEQEAKSAEASDIKARSQAAKTVAQMGKIVAETDILEEQNLKGQLEQTNGVPR